MKKILFLLALIIVTACSNDDEVKDPENTTAENYHSFFENSQLILNSGENPEQINLELATGNKLVFKFLKYEDPYPEYVDDEQTTIVYFEVDPDASEFRLEKDDFNDANAAIGLGGQIRIIERITEGSITGTKISDNEWEIALDVSTMNEEINYEITAEASTSFNKSTFEGIWMPIYTY